MEYIQGKFKQLIYEGDNGYKVGLFRVKESSDILEELVGEIYDEEEIGGETP